MISYIIWIAFFWISIFKLQIYRVVHEMSYH